MSYYDIEHYQQEVPAMVVVQIKARHNNSADYRYFNVKSKL